MPVTSRDVGITGISCSIKPASTAMAGAIRTGENLPFPRISGCIRARGEMLLTFKRPLSIYTADFARAVRVVRAQANLLAYENKSIFYEFCFAMVCGLLVRFPAGELRLLASPRSGTDCPLHRGA